MVTFNPNEKKSKIDSIKDSLYSRNADSLFLKKRHEVSEDVATKAPSIWKIEEERPESTVTIPYAKILLGAFIFFVLALGFAFYKFFAGSNTVSGDNIDIAVSGPTSIAGGEELSLDIQVKNNNNIDLKVVDLHVEYPDGTRDPLDLSKDLKRYSEVLGDIKIGQSMHRTVKAVLFGQENTQQIVKVTVEYRIAGSNAIFNKEKDYNVLISSSPVNIKVTGAGEINANQQTDFTVDVTSNSLTTLKGLILKVDYPFGFNLNSANPKPTTSDGTIFDIGDLEPRAHRTIRISGIIQGQDREERVLKFTVGTPDKNDYKTIGTPFAMYTASVTLKKPFIGLTMLIDQNSAKEVAIDPGSKISANINWQNNLPDKVTDMTIKIKFTGQTLDKSSMSVDNGFYSSVDNTITFDKNGISEIGTVNPGDEGNMRFDFATLIPSLNSSISFGNAKILMDISVYGSTIGGASPYLLFSDTKTLKISSGLKLLARGFRTVGPFENSGPFPPKVDNESTYTITWTATNSYNNTSNVRVSAILPPNVKWKGFTSPDTEKISYDNGRGEVVWDVGNMRSGTGSTYPARDVSFQVGITPSITQVGAVLNLLNESTVSGIDDFSGDRIGEIKVPVTTNITSDPAYIEDIGKVVQ